MNKPEPYQYYDCWEVIRYMSKKYKIKENIITDFISEDIIGDNLSGNGYLATMYMEDYMHDFEEKGLMDKVELCQKFINEFGNKFDMHYWW